MCKIRDAFERAKADSRIALIGYLPSGYPNPDAFIRMAKIAFQSGLDVMEIGMPTQRPDLDGKVIRQALKETYAQGITVDSAIDIAGELLTQVDGAGLFMLYDQVLQDYGMELLLQRAAQSGVTGMLPVGMLPDKWLSFAEKARQLRVSPIGFVTPDADQSWISVMSEKAGGFMYVQSQNGQTGQQGDFGSSVKSHLEFVRESSSQVSLPIALGFGIRSAEDVIRVRKMGADGVIVGTALVEAALQGEQAVQDLIGSLAAATRWDE
jgi:tryptophan synthase alpha chain